MFSFQSPQSVSAKLFDDVCSFIEQTAHLQQVIHEEWSADPQYQRINFRRKRLSDLHDQNSFRCYLQQYRTYAQLAILEIDEELMPDCPSGIREWRVKEWESIESKIVRYMDKEEKGKVPLSKCLNDLVGFRLILSESADLECILKQLDDAYSLFHCTNASKGEYIAIHIYPKNSNVFPIWEIQIWNPEDEANNKESHGKYKLGYTLYSLKRP